MKLSKGNLVGFVSILFVLLLLVFVFPIRFSYRDVETQEDKVDVNGDVCIHGSYVKEHFGTYEEAMKFRSYIWNEKSYFDYFISCKEEIMEKRIWHDNGSYYTIGYVVVGWVCEGGCHG